MKHPLYIDSRIITSYNHTIILTILLQYTSIGKHITFCKIRGPSVEHAPGPVYRNVIRVSGVFAPIVPQIMVYKNSVDSDTGRYCAILGQQALHLSHYQL